LPASRGGTPAKEAKEAKGGQAARRATPWRRPERSFSSGAGNGPASSGLDPQPRNFTSAEWQAEVTDEHIERIIVSGGAAVGRSPAMPNNPDLNGKPEVVRGLRQIIRSFGSE
jgi:hypothetical protein